MVSRGGIVFLSEAVKLGSAENISRVLCQFCRCLVGRRSGGSICGWTEFVRGRKISSDVYHLGWSFSSDDVIFNTGREKMSLLEVYALGSAITAIFVLFIYFLARKS